MNESKADEWTFVPSKNKKKSSSKATNKKRERQLAKAKHLLNTIHGKDVDVEDNDNEKNHKDQDEKRKSLIRTIEQCMRDLNNLNNWQGTQRPVQSTVNFDMQTLGNSIQEAANINTKDKRKVDEIICYGIGNFNNSSSTSYNAPLIQLACVLLLRQTFASKCIDRNRREKIDGDRNQNGYRNDCVNPHDHDDDVNKSQNISYEMQQELVSTVYFEPFIQPMEEKVLAYFHLQVLDKNEHGKRCIDTVREESVSTHSDKSKFCTLFYMPHCPMRLYSNVLWANWDEELVMDGRMVLFGNSFKAYDERIISSEQKKDKTNAIFPLLAFAIETPVLQSQGNRNHKNSKKSRIVNDWEDGMSMSMQDLEISFNDCVIMSFANDGKLHFPGRPEEYFVDSSGDGGELI